MIKRMITRMALGLFVMCIGSAQIFSQQQQPVTPQNIIEVTGSAEMEIVPDEVYLSVTLREYMKNSSNKIDIGEIDKGFKKLLTDLKIDMKNVSLAGANGYQSYIWYRQKKTDFLASKTYIIKLSDMQKYNEMMDKIDGKGVENVYIQKVSHSKIEEYRKQVKVEALIAAKEKAKLLVEAVGQQLGNITLIRERNNDYYGGYVPMMKTMSNSVMSAEDSSEPNIEMEKIKLRYEVEAHFIIK